MEEILQAINVEIISIVLKLNSHYHRPSPGDVDYGDDMIKYHTDNIACLREWRQIIEEKLSWKSERK